MIVNGQKVLFAPAGTKVKVDGVTQGEWNADTKADKTEMNGLLDQKQNKLTAGKGTNINGDIIEVNESVFGVPSNDDWVSISVTVGSTTKYTAPANGYISVSGNPKSTSLARIMIVNCPNFGNLEKQKLGNSSYVYDDTDKSIIATCPCKKGDNFNIFTTNVSGVVAHFVPSEV